MNVSIEKILGLRFLPIVDLEKVKNLRALIETLLSQDVSVLQLNFKNAEQLEQGKICLDLAKEYPEMHIGAGFFYSDKDAEKAIQYGVKFVVSSVLQKEILAMASSNNVPAIISGFTPTEVYDAYSTNVDLVQIFPASQLHYKSIISILEYLPNANFLLTGGLTLSSALDFLQNGAKAVGLKTALFAHANLAEERYKEIGLAIKNLKDRIHH